MKTPFGDRIVPVFKPNGGQASAINAGFRACSGKYIFLLDADDCFKPDKVAQVLKMFNEHPNAKWCFHELEEVDASGQLLIKRNRHRIIDFEVVNLRHILTEGKNFSHWFPATSGLCFCRDILEEILPLPEAFRVSADSLIRLAAIYFSPGILSPKTFATHRCHGKNLYDFRTDIHIERSKLGIKTAYFLHEKIPNTRLFTNKIFIFNVGKLTEYLSFKKVLDIPEYKLYTKQEKNLEFLAKLTAYIIKGSVKHILSSKNS
jgi:glycosyltransferase involved in cell wall biosynthesis